MRSPALCVGSTPRGRGYHDTSLSPLHPTTHSILGLFTHYSWFYFFPLRTNASLSSAAFDLGVQKWNAPLLFPRLSRLFSSEPRLQRSRSVQFCHIPLWSLCVCAGVCLLYCAGPHKPDYTKALWLYNSCVALSWQRRRGLFVSGSSVGKGLWCPPARLLCAGCAGEVEDYCSTLFDSPRLGNSQTESSSCLSMTLELSHWRASKYLNTNSVNTNKYGAYGSPMWNTLCCLYSYYVTSWRRIKVMSELQLPAVFCPSSAAGSRLIVHRAIDLSSVNTPHVTSTHTRVLDRMWEEGTELSVSTVSATASVTSHTYNRTEQSYFLLHAQ